MFPTLSSGNFQIVSCLKMLDNSNMNTRTLPGIVAKRLQDLERNPFEAARVGGLERSFMNDLLNGKKKSVRGDNLEKLARALDWQVNELLSAARQIQVVGAVGTSAEVIFHAEGQDDWISAPSFATERTVTVEIRGDSLGRILDGWLVYYDDAHHPPTTDLLGSLCVVGVADGRVMVKQLDDGQLPGRFTLTSNAEPPIYDVEISWAAKVRGILPR